MTETSGASPLSAEDGTMQVWAETAVTPPVLRVERATEKLHAEHFKLNTVRWFVNAYAPICVKCGEFWPCSTIVVLDSVAALQAEVAELTQRIEGAIVHLGSPAKCGAVAGYMSTQRYEPVVSGKVNCAACYRATVDELTREGERLKATLSDAERNLEIVGRWAQQAIQITELVSAYQKYRLVIEASND